MKYAKLLTTSDTNNKISVAISNGKNKLYGLIKDYNYNNNYLEVEGISNTETVRNVFIIDDKQIVRAILIYPMEIGQVKIKGQVWSALADDSLLTIEEGTYVTIKAIEGVKLIVIPKV